LYGPDQVFVVVKLSYILANCPYLDNLGFDICGAGGPHSHFMALVTIAVRIH